MNNHKTKRQMLHALLQENPNISNREFKKKVRERGISACDSYINIVYYDLNPKFKLIKSEPSELEPLVKKQELPDFADGEERFSARLLRLKRAINQIMVKFPEAMEDFAEVRDAINSVLDMI